MAVSTIGGMANNLFGQVMPILDLIKGLTLIAGVVIFAVGIVKFTKHQEGGTGAAIRYMVAGVMLAGIAAMLLVGTESIGAGDTVSGGWFN